MDIMIKRTLALLFAMTTAAASFSAWQNVPAPAEAKTLEEIEKESGIRLDALQKEAVLARKAQCFLPLREILLEAGFTEVAQDPDLDLRDLKKDSLLALFS